MSKKYPTIYTISNSTNPIPLPPLFLSPFISKLSFLFSYQVFIKSCLIIFRLLTSFTSLGLHTRHTNSFLCNTLRTLKEKVKLHFLEGFNRLILVINFIISLKNVYKVHIANNLCDFINYQVYKVGFINL
jgi:hypothetical protein